MLVGDRALLERRGGRPVPEANLLHVPLAPPAPPAASIPPTPVTCSPCSTRRSTAALAGRFDAMVTAPVHKGVINDAGVPFTGHTEYLAERTRRAACR